MMTLLSLRSLLCGVMASIFGLASATIAPALEPESQPRIRADRFVQGGASLERLWNAGMGKGTARAKILEKKWDYVILQEIYVAKPDSLNKYAPLFHELIQ